MEVLYAVLGIFAGVALFGALFWGVFVGAKGQGVGATLGRAVRRMRR